MIFTFPMPAAGINGTQLEAELGAARIDGAVSVTTDGEVAVGTADDVDVAAVQAALDAHVPAATPAAVTPDVELREAIASATSWQQLQSALLGKDCGAVVAARAKDAGW